MVKTKRKKNKKSNKSNKQINEDICYFWSVLNDVRNLEESHRFPAARASLHDMGPKMCWNTAGA